MTNTASAPAASARRAQVCADTNVEPHRCDHRNTAGYRLDVAAVTAAHSSALRPKISPGAARGNQSANAALR